MSDSVSIEYVPLSELLRWPGNPKQHASETIMQSINRFGFVNPVLLDERTGRLVAGHGRLESLQTLQTQGAQPPRRIKVDSSGNWLVPVVRGVSFNSDSEAEAYLLADNQLTIAGGWEEQALARMLADLQASGEDVSTLGWNDEELAEVLASLQELPDLKDIGAPPVPLTKGEELAARWGVAPGQIWAIPSTNGSGEHRLACGDCTSAELVARLMGDDAHKAALFATDPPYLVEYTGGDLLGEGTIKNWDSLYRDKGKDDDGRALYDGYIRTAIECAIAKNAAWYHWHAALRASVLEAAWAAHGALYHQQIIWDKDRPVLTYAYYMWRHEPCMYGWLKGHKPNREASDYPSTVWSFPVVQAPGESTDHPTPKPVELFRIPIEQHTKRGDICYEPFAGSGTQFIAAEQLGRLCYGLEIQPAFVALILQRLADMGLEPYLTDL